MDALEIVQFTFYLLGSIFMLGLVGMVVTLIIVMIAIKTKVEETSTYVRSEVTDFKEHFFERMVAYAFANKEKIGSAAATAASGYIVSQLKKKFQR